MSGAVGPEGSVRFSPRGFSCAKNSFSCDSPTEHTGIPHEIKPRGLRIVSEIYSECCPGQTRHRPLLLLRLRRMLRRLCWCNRFSSSIVYSNFQGNRVSAAETPKRGVLRPLFLPLQGFGPCSSLRDYAATMCGARNILQLRKRVSTA